MCMTAKNSTLSYVLEFNGETVSIKGLISEQYYTVTAGLVVD